MSLDSVLGVGIPATLYPAAAPFVGSATDPQGITSPLMPAAGDPGQMVSFLDNKDQFLSGIAGVTDPQEGGGSRSLLNVVFHGNAQELADYNQYFDKAQTEAKDVNTHYSTGLNPFKKPAAPASALTPDQYVQVRAALNQVQQTAGASGDPDLQAKANKLPDWLSKGYVLQDGTLDNSTSAETRRDGSSKPWFAPTENGPMPSNNVSFDGNVYLNPHKDGLFFPPPDLEQSQRALEHYKSLQASGHMTPAQQSEMANLELRTDPKASQLYLESVMVHEITHTDQRFGNKASKESGAYDAQLAYLQQRLDQSQDPSEQHTIQVVMQRVRLDRGEQAQ